MATGRSSFAKRQRDMAKKARAQAKRSKRLDGDPEGEETVEEEVVESKYSNEQLMQMIADLHERYDDGQMSLDDFEEKRTELMGQITVE